MSAPVQVRNGEVADLIRRLASLRGESITRALGAVVAPEVERLENTRDRQNKDKRRRIEATLAQWDALPIVGEPLTDDDLYDQDGLPR